MAEIIVIPEFITTLGLESVFNDSLKVLLAEVATDVLNIDNYASIIARAMELVDGVKQITGAQKKEAVVYLVDKIHDYIIKHTNASDEVKSLTAIIFSPSSISTVIETIIAITQNKFHINEKHISCMTNLAQSLKGFCNSRAKSTQSNPKKK